MRIGVLGTGMVGQALATRLSGLGDPVMMGSRQAGNEKAVAWVASAGAAASQGSFAEAAEFGEIVINATSGGASLDALTAAGAGNLAGKILIDIANPIDHNSGMPPTLAFCNTDSLAERIQRQFPEARVVKALNTMNCNVMVHPDSIPGHHNVFLSGNDAGAKAEVRNLLQRFGWPDDAIIDLGDVASARGTEMFLALWLRLMLSRGNADFNVSVVGGGS